eukprot:537482-Pleurochrysis_carterae.AAC.1
MNCESMPVSDWAMEEAPLEAFAVCTNVWLCSCHMRVKKIFGLCIRRSNDKGGNWRNQNGPLGKLVFRIEAFLENERNRHNVTRRYFWTA